MEKINLRKYYPNYYKQDCFVEVTDDVFETIKKAERKEAAYHERVRYHKAYYHLLSFCEVKYNALNIAVILTPDKIYENKAEKERLYNAIYKLPQKQARRIYARYFLGMSLKSIAGAEGISIPAVHYSVYSRLRRLKKFLKNFR